MFDNVVLVKLFVFFGLFKLLQLTYQMAPKPPTVFVGKKRGLVISNGTTGILRK